LLSYFIIGSAIAYLLSKGESFPGLSSYTENCETRKTKDLEKFGITVFLVFVYAASSHIILIIMSKLWPTVKLGSARDTLNAWLASAAVMLPLNVISLRLNNTASLFLFTNKKNQQFSARRNDSLEPAFPGPASGVNLTAGIILFVLSLAIDSCVFIYSGLSLAYMHRLAPMLGILPGLLYLFLFSVAIFAKWLHGKFKAWNMARNSDTGWLLLRNPYMPIDEPVSGKGDSEIHGDPVERHAASENRELGD
jgi:hypothetical protein